MKVYLSGPIEHAPDGGLAWRRQLTAFLVDVLRHEVYDPAHDQKKNLTEEERVSFRSWKVTSPDRFRETIRKIIDYDLAKLEDADYVICNWDRNVARGAGTQGELTFARHRRIPVYLVSSVPLAEISGWILGCSDQVFFAFEELRRFLIRQYTAQAETVRDDRN